MAKRAISYYAARIDYGKTKKVLRIFHKQQTNGGRKGNAEILIIAFFDNLA